MLSAASTPMSSMLTKEQRLAKAREVQAQYKRRVVTIDIPQSPEPRPKKIKIEFFLLKWLTCINFVVVYLRDLTDLSGMKREILEWK